MNITLNKKDIELKFDFRFLREIDSRLGIKMEGGSIGRGVSMLPLGLSAGNPVTIGETILAATAYKQKKRPTVDDLDDILDDIAENVGLEEFGEQIIEELGKATYDPKPRSENRGTDGTGNRLTYDQVIITCMAELNITDLKQIEQMTLSEYNYRMYALEFVYLRKEFERYKTAFAIRDAAATKNVGTDKEPKEEYVFKTVTDVIDYSDNYERLTRGEPIRFTDEIEDIEPRQIELYNVIADINRQTK